MADPPDVEETFLTERQAEVLSLRHEGLTQREIADRLGTTAANVSAVEGSVRRNVESARRTLALARLLRTAVRFTLPEGTDLHAVVDRIYAAGDDAGLKIAHTEPELVSRLNDRLGDRLEGRQLVEPVEIGITDDGEVVAYPSAGELNATG